MLTHYIQAALQQARLEWLSEDHEFYGEIPGIPGVWATGSTKAECRDELQEALEEWLSLGLAMHHSIPPINGIDVNVETVY